MPSLTSILIVLIPFIVAGLTVTANAVVNAKIRFAPDMETAFRDLKALGWRIVAWVGNVAVLVFLVLALVRKGPVTRLDVLEIATYVATLFAAVIMYIQRELMRVVSGMIDTNREHLSITRSIAEALGGTCRPPEA